MSRPTCVEIAQTVKITKLHLEQSAQPLQGLLITGHCMLLKLGVRFQLELDLIKHFFIFFTTAFRVEIDLNNVLDKKTVVRVCCLGNRLKYRYSH